MSDTVQYLPLNQLQPNPFQPRGHMHQDDLDELVESIKTYGILEPLIIAHTPAGYQIIAGERRWRAAKLAGLEKVPALVKQTTPKGMLEMALVENVQRVDLTPIERAQAFQQLQREFSLSTAQIAQRIGKSPAYVSNTMKLLQLPDAIKDGLLGGLITEGHARALSSIEKEKSMVDCYKVILKESASVRRAEELSRRYRERDLQQRDDVRGGQIPRSMQITDDQVHKWEERVQAHFHVKTNLKVTRSVRYTTVMLRFNGTPERTQQDLQRFLEYMDKKSA